MSSSATTTATPLTTFTQQLATNNATRSGVNGNAPSTSLAVPAQSSALQTASQTPSASVAATNALTTTVGPANNSSQLQALPRYANRPPTWSEKLANSLTLANGLGTMALIAAFIFGVGAWVGMKVQISQGGKSMELAIWTTCADHEIIQNSTLCQSIMAKDFSELASRDLTSNTKDITVVVKRDVGSSGSDDLVSIEQSHYSKFISKLSPSDRSLIETKDNEYSDRYHQADPAIRATIFPLVQLLVMPLQWVFDFLESILLLVVFCVHKVLSWMTWIFIFILQATIYSTIESVLNAFLRQLDAAIYASLPAWMPYLLASNLASWFGLSALRSFWYGTNYLQSLKWIFIFRVGMWAVVEGVKGGCALWVKWNEVVEERRRMKAQVADQFGLAAQDWNDTPRSSFLAGMRRR